MPRDVRPERTGWRDLRLSERHRRWGWDCPAIDLDFLMLEYDRGVASALVEYKHEMAPMQPQTHPSVRAIKDLGNRAALPALGCRYADDFGWFRAVALNPLAKRFLPASPMEMAEREWVSLLYRMRGHEMPDDLFDEMEVLI
jgi:hypothetical protein